MLKIGLTGIIGSGKSVVANVFRHLGVPVFFSDKVAQSLMENHPLLQRKISLCLGESAYTDAGKLNKSYISERIFNNPELREKLQAIVHTLVIEESNAWFDKQQTDYALKESALLLETKKSQHLDYIITVSAPVEVCMQRVLSARDMSKEKVRNIIKMQLENNDYSQVDFTLDNSGEIAIIPQILHLHKRFARSSL